MSARVTWRWLAGMGLVLKRCPSRPILNPLVPAKAGIQVFLSKGAADAEKAWVPAFAGMSG